MADKPLTDLCAICGNKIHLDRGFGWADIGPKSHPETSVHVECLGMGPFMEQLQNGLNKVVQEKT